MGTSQAEDLEKQALVARRAGAGNDSCEGGAAGVGATFGSSVVTLTTWIMGCGVLALPRVFALCGVVPGLLLLALFASWVETSLRWTVACGRFSGSCSFEGNARYFLGPVGARVVRGSQLALLFGGIVSCFVVVASLLPCIARDFLAHVCDASGSGPFVASPPGVEDLAAPGTGEQLRALAASGVCWAHPMPCLPRGRLIATVTAILFPLSSQGSLHALRRLSSLGLGCFVYFFAMMLVRVLAATWRGIPMASGKAGDGTFWQGPPILLMSLLCHTSILCLDKELGTETRPLVGSVISTVVLRIALPVYALVGVGGYLLCGPGVASNVLEAFESDAWMVVARLTLGFMNMVKIPLGIVALREVLVSLLPCSWARRQFEETGLGRAAATAVLLVAASLAASTLGSLSRVLSLTGCTVGVLFSLCLPAALYWRLLGCLELCEGTSSDRLRAMRRPLLPSGRGAGGGGVAPIEHGGVASAAAAAARVGGIVELPRGRAAWLRHRLACATVFSGGVAIGLLGLCAWLAEGAATAPTAH